MAIEHMMYDTICKALDARELKYRKHEEDLVVILDVNGESIPMEFILMVDKDRQRIRLLSPMPFKMREEKAVEGAIATCAASYGMVDGGFDYNISDGEITFRMTHSYLESTIGEGAIEYMISCAFAMVDKYNFQFLAINKGLLSINDFLKKEND